MPVLGATALMAHKLGALEEHACDLTKVLPAARAVREQVDWAAVAGATAESPFARACLVMLRDLGIAEAPNASLSPPAQPR